MKSNNLLKHVGIAFAIALLLYIGFYNLDRWLRTRQGPWEITFIQNNQGEPAMIIRHQKLGIRDVKVIFENETMAVTNLPASVRFDQPKTEPPFGKWKYDDLMYQPGVVTLDMFGHEVELLPRILILNRTEHPWKSGSTYRLNPEDKLKG